MAEVFTLHSAEPGRKPGFCLTPTAESIFAALKACQTMRGLGCITGGPGVGKSISVSAFADDVFNRVTLCRMTKAAGRMQPGLVRIVTAVGGWATPQMGSADLYNEIVRCLKRSSDQLLILDEAQHMDDELLETIRDLFDEGLSGFVLVASMELTERFEARSAAKRRKWAQFTSRMTVGLDIPSVLPEDIEAFCDLHGIAGKRSRDLLFSAANGDGGLRNVMRRLDIARNLAKGGTIQLNHLEEAERVLGVRD